METLTLTQATDALLSALCQTEEFRRYTALKESVMADEGQKALLRRFTSVQTTLQMAALAGAEAKEEDTSAFERLSALIYANGELTDYLLAQMKVQQLAAGVMEKITQAVGLDIPLP